MNDCMKLHGTHFNTIPKNNLTFKLYVSYLNNAPTYQEQRKKPYNYLRRIHDIMETNIDFGFYAME